MSELAIDLKTVFKEEKSNILENVQRLKERLTDKMKNVRGIPSRDPYEIRLEDLGEALNDIADEIQDFNNWLEYTTSRIENAYREYCILSDNY